MKQPTLSFKIGLCEKTYPIETISFNKFGEIFSVTIKIEQEIYYFYNNGRNEFYNAHGNLKAIINWL